MRHWPLTGALIATDLAPSTPLTSMVPAADTHAPVTTSDDFAAATTSYDVRLVVVTVDALPDPKAGETVNDDPLIEITVPMTPPPNLPRTAPGPRPLGPPGGGDPLAKDGPPRTASQPSVLVMVTDRAVTLLGGAVEPAASAGALTRVGEVAPTDTQSPFISEARVAADDFVKRVEELNATVDGPLVVCTEALVADAAIPLLVTTSNAAVDAGPPVPDATWLDGELPPPQPTAKTPRSVAPAADVTIRAVRRNR